MSEKIYKTFKDFWPFYLSQHSHPLNRRLHVIGVAFVFAVLFYALYSSQPIWLWLCPFLGYGFAWFGHFVIEKNRPATFTYPLWSLIGDFKMFFLTVAGKLK